jgi:hypothetical protein
MPCLRNSSAGPYAGELQQLRRIVSAARNQDLLARPRGSQASLPAVLDRDRTTAIEQDALRQRRCLDMQVGARPGGAKIGHRGTGSSAVARRGLKISGAFLGGAVEIGVFGDAGLCRRLDECRGERIGMTQIGYRLRAADAVKLVGAARLVLGFLEIGQDVVITPAIVAALAPAIVILALAADVQQAR